VQTVDVLDLEEQAGGKPRVLLVKGGLPKERALAGQKVAPLRDWPAIEVKSEHVESTPPERFLRHCDEEGLSGGNAGERTALAALPATRLEPQECLTPGVEIAAGAELEVLELPNL
jgi:hypothetical protein